MSRYKNSPSISTFSRFMPFLSAIANEICKKKKKTVIWSVKRKIMLQAFGFVVLYRDIFPGLDVLAESSIHDGDLEPYGQSGF